jgi:uncharacterized protein YbaP (TraB family)
LLRESDYPLPVAYEKAYAAAEELVFELPPGSSESPELSRRMQELGMLPVEEALQKLISAEDWKRVTDWSTRRGVDVAVVDRMRPWYASLLMVATEYAALGAAADRGVDQFFEERGKKDGKAGSGLETVEQQLALFSGMTGEQEREVLEQRFGLGDGAGRTLEEVGRQFRVTRERIRQIEAKALRKLRHPTRIRKLGGFFGGS